MDYPIELFVQNSSILRYLLKLCELGGMDMEFEIENDNCIVTQMMFPFGKYFYAHDGKSQWHSVIFSILSVLKQFIERLKKCVKLQMDGIFHVKDQVDVGSKLYASIMPSMAYPQCIQSDSLQLIEINQVIRVAF